MKSIERQAQRGTLKVVSGVNTRKVTQRFFGGRDNPTRNERLLCPEALIRLYNRKPQGFDEKSLLILLAAQKTGELVRNGNGMSSFRGMVFFTLRGDVPRGIFRRLTAEEIVRDKIPMPD